MARWSRPTKSGAVVRAQPEQFHTRAAEVASRRHWDSTHDPIIETISARAIPERASQCWRSHYSPSYPGHSSRCIFATMYFTTSASCPPATKMPSVS